MRNRTHIAAMAAFVMVVVSTGAFGYALLSPARRWFNADTPRQVNVDNGGVASVTGGDPDHGVTAAVNAVKAWNGGGVNVRQLVVQRRAIRGTGSATSSSAIRCTSHGTCPAATLTGYYSTSTPEPAAADGDKITDADVAFNLSYNTRPPHRGAAAARSISTRS
jgi:hypothetical protein